MLVRATTVPAAALVLILLVAPPFHATGNADKSNTEDSAERLVIPLAAPDRPAFVGIVLAQGHIEVQAGSTGEVIIEVTPMAAGIAEDHDGLFVIPGSALDMPIEAAGNRVSIGMWSTRVKSIRVTAPSHTSVTTKTTWAGDVVVNGLHGAHELNTNGGLIQLTRGRGSVVANSKNGIIDVELLEVTPGKPMSFTTLNGSIEVGFPAGFEANLRLSPGMGDIQSEFEIALEESPTRVSKQQTPKGISYHLAREVRGTIGGGGPEVWFRTHLGSIVLRKLTASD